MILLGKLNDKCFFEKNSGSYDIYGENIHLYGEHISCYKENQEKLVENPFGNIVRSRTVYFTKEEIKPADILDGFIVLKVEKIIDVYGKTHGYKSFI